MRLVEETFARGTKAIILPSAARSELTAWANVRIREDEIFSPGGQCIFFGEAEEGRGWRLLIDPYGYLVFRAMGEGGPECSSVLPLLSYLDGRRAVRLGLSIVNALWSARGKPAGYARGSDVGSRVRLLVASGRDRTLMVAGELRQLKTPDLQTVPRRIAWRDSECEPFRGQVIGFSAYAIEKVEAINRPSGSRSARSIFPDTPGGGVFEPRWINEKTVEVFTPPGSGFWLYTRIRDPGDRLRRIRVRPGFRSVNMMPTFFVRRPGGDWHRRVPSDVRMRMHGFDYEADIPLAAGESADCWLACAIPFLEEDRAELVRWASSRLDADVMIIGHSVGGRPIELLRVGAAQPKLQVAILCGQHSPLEIMTGHVLRPMLAEVHALGLFDRVAMHIVPTVNVDCAHHGGSGLNLNRCNLNRHWFTDPEPENRACLDYFEAMRRARRPLHLAMDFHAGGVFRNHSIHTMGEVEGRRLPDRAWTEQEVWRDRLEAHAGLRRVDSKPSRIRRFRAADYFIRRFGCPSFTMELSTCSYFDPVARCSKVFEPRALNIVGRGIARALADALA